MSQEKLFKHLYEGTVAPQEIGYHLQATSNKRASIYNSDGLMVGTRPYYYSDIEVKSDSTED